MRYTLVYYSLDGGGSWTLIDTVFTGVTQCPWTTPAGFYPNSRVKVEATDVAGNVGSDEVGFYIGSDIPQVEIHFPVEGMLIYSDSTYQLNWLSTCTSAINNTLIEYSLNDGLVWDTLYNLPGGSDTTRPWTTPDSFSVYARIKITAYNLLLIPGSDTVSFDLAPDYMEAGFPAGWNLLSIPLTPPNNSINAVFGDDISGIYFVYNYSPSSGFGLVNQVATGVGYWLGLFNSAQVDITGEPELDTCYASVSAGWNMVGAGIPTAVSIDSLLFRHNNITYSYRDAVVNSLIYPTFWEYSLADYDTASALLPWGGYWLFALVEDLQMLEYPPYPGIGLLDFASIGEAGPTESNWQINIELQQGETGSIITALGVNEEATDSFDVWYDWVAPPVPPNGEYLRGVFYHQEWGCPAGYKFCRDFRAPFAQDNDQPQMEEWCLTLESSDPGLITVNFEQVLENLPAGYSGIVLYNDTTLNFRQAHYFDFDYVQPLPVTIRIFNRSATLLGWDLLGPELELPTEYSIAAIYPNPFNSRTVIKIGLPQACHLNLTLYNVLGRQVTILSDGYQPAGYHLFEFDGEGVSSGIYFVRAVSPSKFNQMKKIVLIK
jgi:hypothetical protein